VDDISQPLGPQGGALVEVNAGPSLITHLKPADGEPRPVGRAIVDHLFPAGDLGRIPVVGIAGSGGLTPVARLVAWLLAQDGREVGLACAAGLYLGDQCLDPGDCAHWEPAQRLLINPLLEAVVIENGMQAMLREGLAYDRCLIGVVTSLAPDASFPDLQIDGVDAVWGVLRTQVDVVLSEGTAVLNGDDPKVAEMVELCDGHVILYGRDGASPQIVAHRATGRRAAFARGRDVVLADSREEIVITSLLTTNDADAVLPTAAVAWALGLAPAAIRASIVGYEPPGAPRAARIPHSAHAAT
jgi:cyanophycin synthetase